MTELCDCIDAYFLCCFFPCAIVCIMKKEGVAAAELPAYIRITSLSKFYYLYNSLRTVYVFFIFFSFGSNGLEGIN